MDKRLPWQGWLAFFIALLLLGPAIHALGG